MTVSVDAMASLPRRCRVCAWCLGVGVRLCVCVCMFARTLAHKHTQRGQDCSEPCAPRGLDGSWESRERPGAAVLILISGSLWPTGGELPPLFTMASHSTV